MRYNKFARRIEKDENCLKTITFCLIVVNSYAKFNRYLY
jgi:hypothetical protein